MSESRYIESFDIKHQVRLLILNPVRSDLHGEGPLPVQTQGLLSDATQVDEVFCPEGPDSIDGSREEKAAAPLVVAKAKWAEENGYDVVLLNCMLDPGLDDARKAVSIPVIGLKQASSLIALLVGDQPGFFDPEAIRVSEYTDDREATYRLMLDAGRRKVYYQGANVLVPNCTYLGGMAGRLQDDLGVPVLANRDIALRVVELLANFRLKPEANWVAGRRSKSRILMTKLYKAPLLGPALYRLVRILKALI